VNPCVSFPCQHGGKCQSNGTTSYSCSCIQNAFGQNCESYVNTLTNSSVLNLQQMQNLKQLTGFTNLSLIYRASRHGFGSDSFHSMCDGAYGTLIVIKTDSSLVLGGYTQADWSGYGFKYDSNAFLFSLNTPYMTPPFLINVSQPMFAIYADPNNGPIFGTGHDLFIAGYSKYQSNSYLNMDHSYATNITNLNGYHSFSTIDIEVYSIPNNNNNNYNPCLSNPCMNGLICVLDANSSNSYNCICRNQSYDPMCYKPNSNIFQNSNILNQNQSIQLLTVTGIPNNNNTKFRMLYQATRDGFGASVFHSKCDGILGTLTIIRDINSNIFGGYTQADWYGNYQSKYDADAFLFSLVNEFNIPFRLNVTQPSNAILAYPYMGPNFGYDLSIADHSNTNFNSYYYKQGHSYQAFPNNTASNSSKTRSDSNYFYFQTAEIEVYSLNRNYRNYITRGFLKLKKIRRF
jgi:hypothetical protein